MTNEEFEAHLMSAIHGPNAEKIVERLVEVLGQTIQKDPTRWEQVGEAFAEILGQIDDRIMTLEMFALASTWRLPGGSPVGDAVKVGSLVEATKGEIRKSLSSVAGSIGMSELREILGMIGVPGQSVGGD